MPSQAFAPKNNKRPFVMRKGISVLGDLADGNAANLALAGAKTIYYCDGNYGSDGNSGVGGWDNAVQTLAAAMALSQADISSGAEGWAARNVILCKGDAFTEDLVLLAQKTYVIGVGSYNAKAQACLVGNHVPTGTTTTAYGTRFFNFRFMGDATTGGDIWTLDSTVSDLEFHNCIFHAAAATVCTAAIIDTASPFLGIYGCEFRGLWSDACIEFGAGAGLRGTRIIGNYIEGADVGIEIASGATVSTGASLLDCIIKDNVINTAGLCIDDNADLAFIIGNYCFTDGDTGSAGAGVIDGNTDISMANRISGSDIDNTEWPALGTLG